MTKKKLVIYIPVIHRGYLDFLNAHKSEVDTVYILDNEFVHSLYKYEPDIAALTPSESRTILETLGYEKIMIVNEKNASSLKEFPLILIKDDISESLFEKYLGNADIEWKSVFLRWDRKKIISDNSVEVQVSSDKKDINFMNEAYKEAEKSSDWWRQVGAVLVDGEKVILRGYNKGLPDDHSPYKNGGIRDFMEVGENPELSPTIHAEQKIITDAASKGMSTKNNKLYVTHFPCPVCSKLIASAGFSHCYFGEGSSSSDGKMVLESQGVKVIKVNL